MGLTFIFGNGLDLSLGLKTRYIDVYEKYIKEIPDDPVIKNFKEVLKKDKRAQYKDWSDFEIGMAKYADTLQNEEELISCVRDFRRFLTEYLKKQEKDFENILKTHSNPPVFFNAFQQGIGNYAAGLTPNEQRLLSQDDIFPNFLTFNYTRTIELLDEKRPPKEKATSFYQSPIHIHNDLSGMILLGVNDESQVSLKLSDAGRRAFVKQAFNVQWDEERVKKIIKIIYESSTIFIYGWSMGETDAFWVDTIKDWLQRNEDNHLVWFAHGTPSFEAYERDAQMDEEEKQKKILLKMLSLEDKFSMLEKKLHIVLGKGIFEFPPIEKALLVDTEDAS